MAQPPYDPYGGGYGSDPYHQPAQVQHHFYGSTAPANNSMATAAMVVGIVNVVLTLLTCGFFGVLGILAIIFGHVAHSQIKRTGEGGSGMATAGLVLGYLTTVLVIIAWVLLFGVYGWALWEMGQVEPYETY